MLSLEISLMVEGQEGVSWHQWQELASAAERLGFTGLYRSDHYLSEIPDPDRTSLDAWGTICALASITDRIRLGTLVSPVTFRHPSELCKLAVTASHVSAGRVDLGLGAGWMADEHDRYGFGFPALRDRMHMLDEQAEIIRRSWSAGRFDYHGRYYSINGLDAAPKPVGSPRLIIGGEGGPRSIGIAARWADEYNTPLPTNDRICLVAARLADACSAVGRHPNDVALSATYHVLVGRNIAELHAHARRAAVMLGRPTVSPREYLAESRGTCIVGTVEQVIARVQEIEGLGVRRIVLLLVDHTDLEMLELIGTQLLPALESSRRG